MHQAPGMADSSSGCWCCCRASDTNDDEISSAARLQGNFAEVPPLQPRPEPPPSSDRVDAGSTGNGPSQLPLNFAEREKERPITRADSSSSEDSGPYRAIRSEGTSPRIGPTTSLTSGGTVTSSPGSCATRHNMGSTESMVPQHSLVGKSYSTASSQPPEMGKFSSLDSMKVQKSMLPDSCTISDSAHTGSQPAANDPSRDQPGLTNGCSRNVMPQISEGTAMNSDSENQQCSHQMTARNSMVTQHSGMPAMEGMMSSTSTPCSKMSNLNEYGHKVSYLNSLNTQHGMPENELHT